MGWAGLDGGFWLRRLRVLIWGVGVMMVWEGRVEPMPESVRE